MKLLWTKSAILLSLAFLQASHCLEIVDKSQNVQIWQGSSESIHCQADATLDFCKWQKDDFECRVLTEEQTECGVFTASLEGDKCSLTFDEGATRDDVGSYTCLLVQGKDIIEGMIRIKIEFLIETKFLKFRLYGKSVFQTLKTTT